jgi:hypothetical protein
MLFFEALFVVFSGSGFPPALKAPPFELHQRDKGCRFVFRLWRNDFGHLGGVQRSTLSTSRETGGRCQRGVHGNL